MGKPTHVTIASPDGGYDRALTPDEVKKTEEEWVKNEAEEKAKEESAAIEKAEAEKGMNTLCAGLPPAEAAALKKMLNV